VREAVPSVSVVSMSFLCTMCWGATTQQGSGQGRDCEQNGFCQCPSSKARNGCSAAVLFLANRLGNPRQNGAAWLKWGSQVEKFGGCFLTPEQRSSLSAGQPAALFCLPCTSSFTVPLAERRAPCGGPVGGDCSHALALWCFREHRLNCSLCPGRRTGLFVGSLPAASLTRRSSFLLA